MSVLDVNRRGTWALLTLNRPEKRNALSIELRDAVSGALDELEEDAGLKAVAVTGAGDVFSAGFDLREFERAMEDPPFGEQLWASSDRYHHTLVRFPLPLVAAVNGPALAGGFDLAVCCDLRIASTRARFAHPEYSFGDVVYGPLHDLVGGAIARELCMTGREVSASEARELRLVSRVVEPDELLRALDDLMERICAAPRDNLIRTKQKAISRARVADATTLDL